MSNILDLLCNNNIIIMVLSLFSNLLFVELPPLIYDNNLTSSI